jgi:hypothetical protein
MKKSKFLAAAAAMMVGVTMTADVALGQTRTRNEPEVRIEPPTPKRADSSPPVIWNIFAAIVIIGSAFAANMIPSKRGHQD